MNEVIDEPLRSIFTPVLHSGPLQFVLVLLIVGLVVYHFTLSVRGLIGHRAPLSVGHHALLLFSSPAILFLAVVAMLPTTFPNLFIFGIDADQPLKHTLELTSFLGWFCLSSFILNLVLVLVALHPQEPTT